MAIRNAAKAAVVHEGKLLVNRCVARSGEVYYDLPGGGQNQYESMEEAAIREILEETGYRTRINGFLALAEDIYENPEIRRRHPDYAHRIFHIFSASLLDTDRRPAAEKDLFQEESVWVDIEEADRLPFRPTQLTGNIAELLRGSCPKYLGCAHIK